MHTKVNYVRHGQVENPKNVAYGRMAGYHLSAVGKNQAKKVGDYFTEREVAVILTSPLERAFETANILSDKILKHPKVVHKYELTEIDASRWQSFKMEELFQDKYFEAFISDPESKKVPENLTQLARRVFDFTQKICAKYKGKEIICVSHEFPILALRLKLENKSLSTLRNISLETSSITTFILDEKCNLKEVDYIVLN